VPLRASTVACRAAARSGRRFPLHQDNMKTGPTRLMMDTMPSQVPAFYMAIGNAITCWQFVETALGAVFCKVSTCKDDKVALAIFYTLLDFSQKLDICRAAARLSLAGSPLLAEFNTLRTRTRKASELRNALAHFHVSLNMFVGDSVAGQMHRVSSEGELTSIPQRPTPPSRARIMLQPNALDPNEQFRNPRDRQSTKKPMGIRDIVKLTSTFIELQRDLNAFSAKIPQPLEPPTE
jgi:hypothetical protein